MTKGSPWQLSSLFFFDFTLDWDYLGKVIQLDPSCMEQHPNIPNPSLLYHIMPRRCLALHEVTLVFYEPGKIEIELAEFVCIGLFTITKDITTNGHNAIQGYWSMEDVQGLPLFDYYLPVHAIV